MACHLEINGDMGTIGDFRPGWGNERSNGSNSGNNSILNGNLYSSGGYMVNSSGDLIRDADGKPILKTALRDSSTYGSDKFHSYFLSSDRSSHNTNNTNTKAKYLSEYNLGPKISYDQDGNEIKDYSIPTKLDPNKAFKLNGMKFNGEIFVDDDDVGRKLPEREDGNSARKFPTLDMDTIKQQAEGTIGTSGLYTGNTFPDLSLKEPDGAVVWRVPLDESSTFNPDDSTQNLGKATGTLSNMEGYLNGHVILVGTRDNPIQLDGSLVVEGDVIIKGYVQGRGTLYSGGNIYVAGDIVYADVQAAGEDYTRKKREGQNPILDAIYTPHKNVNYDYNDDGAVDEEDVNDLSKDQISAGVSELRLGAKNNIVIGDWTYTQDQSSSAPTFYGYQTFLRSQFKTNNTSTFAKGTQEEVKWRKSGPDGDGYYNDRDEKVSNGDVVSFKDDNQSYNAIFGTTTIKSDGKLHNWMSQADYRKLLYTQHRENQTLAIPTGRKNGNKDYAGLHGEDLYRFLKRYGLEDDRARYIADNASDKYREKEIYYQNGKEKVRWHDAVREVKEDWAWRQAVVDGGREHHVINLTIDNPTKPYRTDPSRIDAYIYASRRIAGHIYGRDLTLNGGMIGDEIGVLAPGRHDFGWLPHNSRYQDFRKNGNATRNDFYMDGHGGKTGKLTVNYDYRLKNGGQSYDLLAEAGTIVFWEKKIVKKKK